MNKQTLHITNGGVLTEYLEDLKLANSKHILTWEEMLCVGPTTQEIDSNAFIQTRKTFFKTFYDITLHEKEISQAFTILDNISCYTEIVLWFEYDLFCHINMVAAISLLEQKNIRLPIYLVCSGRVKGEKELKGLGQLTPKQLVEHYNSKIKLNVDDIALAIKVWRIYCSNNHNNLKPLIVQKSSFPYLSICLKAHIKRFPDSRSGISTLEYNILKLIKENHISSRRHLLGYTLHYQGYYGYGDTQLERIINLLSIFYTQTENQLSLNRNGHLALEHQKNFQKEMNNTIVYGGAKCLEFRFDKPQNKLIKNI